MHILTGMLLSLLLGRKKHGTSGPSIHNRGFPGLIETQHLLPGRMRVYVPGLIGNAGMKERFLESIAKLEKFATAEVSTVTGSILIRYDSGELSPELVFALLVRLLGFEEQVRKTPPSLVTAGMQKSVEGVNRAVYTYSRGIVDLWSLAPLLLIGLGSYRMLTVRENRFPAGFTLLWWAYALIRSGMK